MRKAVRGREGRGAKGRESNYKSEMRRRYDRRISNEERCRKIKNVEREIMRKTMAVMSDIRVTVWRENYGVEGRRQREE